MQISENDPVRTTESSNLVVEARNSANQPCEGVALDYGDSGDTDADMNTSDAGTATVTNGARDRVTDSNGRVTFTRAARAANTYNWRVWADLNPDNDAYDGGEANLTGSYLVYAAAATTIDCSPETSTNPTGTNHTVTCNVDDQQGRDLSGVDVYIVVTAGPNTGDNNGDGTTDANGNRSLTYPGNSGPGTDTIRGCIETTNNQDCTGEAAFDDVQKTWQAPTPDKIDTEPETATNQLGVSHSVTTRVWDQFDGVTGGGVTVSYEFFSGSPSDTDGNTPATPDRTCTTSNSGGWNNRDECTITWTQSSTTGVDLVCSWIGATPTMSGNNTNGTCNGEGLNDAGDANGSYQAPEDGDNRDVIQKTWVPTAPAQALDCTPETDTNPTGTSHTITCTATDANGNSASTFSVDAEATGANDPDGANTPQSPDFTCSTTNGTCSFTHNPPTNTAGKTTYRAWVDADGNNTTVEADTTEALGDDGDEDNTDVVEKTWFGQGFALAVNPTSDAAAVGQCNIFTYTLTDSGGNPVSGADLDIHQTHADFGPPDPPNAPALSFCTQGEVASADPTAPNPSGVTTYGAPAGTQAAGHADNGTNNAGQVTIGIKSTGTGQVAVEGFCEDGSRCPTGATANDRDANEPNANSTKTWNAGGADGVSTVNAEPETDDNPNGTSHTVTVTLTNQQGNPIAGVTPNSLITAGPNNGDSYNCGASNASGVATCDYFDSGATPNGTDTINFWVNQGGGGTPGADPSEPSDSVSKTWVDAPVGLAINLTCEGSSSLDDRDGNDRVVENNTDCRNPLSDTTETFVARVYDPGTDPSAADDTPKQGVEIEFTIPGHPGSWSDVPPPSDAGFTPPGGGFRGPVTCETDADGRCSVTVSNPTPSSGDRISVDARIRGQSVNTAPGKQAGNNMDRATKEWQDRQPAIVTLTPEADTNQVLTSHSVKAVVTDQFGTPIKDRDVTFNVTGRNNGVSGTVKTNANGEATFTYTDSGSASSGGSDQITATVNSVIFGPVSDTADKDWRTSINVTRVEIDNGGDFNGNTENFNDPEWEENTNFPGGGLITNTVGQVHTVVATAFQTTNVNGTTDADGDPVSGTTITYTLSGPGEFTKANGDPLAGCASPCKTITSNMLQDDYAWAFVRSLETGTSTITATANGQSDSGEKVWQSLPARNIDCEPETASNEPGTEHLITCTATDRNGNPTPGQMINVRITSGPGRFSNVGCANTQTNCTQAADADGEVQVVLSTTANEQGTTQVTGELAEDVGDLDGPGDTDDECDRILNDPAGSPAGNCEDQVSKTWEDQPEVFECNDGIDNDGDGQIDFPADPGCSSAQDDDESNQPIQTSGPCQGYPQDSENSDPAISGRVIVGTDGDDLLFGTNGDDVICGLGGKDVISGGNGNDLIVGNGGDDTIEGGSGKDSIRGGGGNDSIDGNRKNDVITGGAGDDTIRGNGGFDTLRGGGGKDTLQGGNGDDILRGGKDNDTLKGFKGDDILNGGQGRDTCKPGAGNDKVKNCEQ